MKRRSRRCFGGDVSGVERGTSYLFRELLRFIPVRMPKPLKLLCKSYGMPRNFYPSVERYRADSRGRWKLKRQGEKKKISLVQSYYGLDLHETYQNFRWEGDVSSTREKNMRFLAEELVK